MPRQDRSTRQELGLVKSDGLQAHHLILASIGRARHPVVKLAEQAGYNMNGVENGMIVKGQQGGHPEYNRRVAAELQNEIEANPSMSPSDAKDFLNGIADRERRRIEDEGRYVRNFDL